MSFLNDVDPEEARGEVLAMYERQQRSFGYVPNYAKPFSHRPELMRLWAELLKGIKRSMDERRFALVSFVAACELKSSACALAFGQKLVGMGVSIDDVVVLASASGSASISAADQAIVGLARKVTRDASSVQPSDVDGARREGVTDAEIFDIVATASARAFFTKIIDGVGAEPDSAFATADTRLRDVLAFGRAISDQEPRSTASAVRR